LTRLARPLELVAGAVTAVLIAVFATGGWTVGGVPFTRAEDLVVVLAALIALRALVAPLAVPTVPPLRAAVVGAFVYAVAMGFIVVSRHLTLKTHALDLGYYVQVVWSIAAGYGPYVTLPPMHAWGDHLSPVFYPLALLGWLVPGAAALLLAQTLILAAGGLAVLGYARRRLGATPVAGGLALLLLVNPSLHGINIRDIHPQAFAIPLLIAAALAFDAERYWWSGAALVATLACREDAAIAVVGFGIWLAVARGRWRLGVGVAVASVLLLAVDLKYVMPYFRGEPYPHLHRYAHLGSSLGDILLSLILKPWRWIGAVLSLDKLVYLLALLLPLGGLPLLGPRALVAALPPLAVNLLSFDHALFHYRSQYQAFVLPFLMLAAVDGYARLRTHRKAGTVLALAFLASAVLTARTANDLMVTRWRLGPEQQAARELMQRIPDGVPASVNERLVPHLATRREIFVYPTGEGRSDYVLEHESVLSAHPASGYREIGRSRSWILLQRST